MRTRDREGSSLASLNSARVGAVLALVVAFTMSGLQPASASDENGSASEAERAVADVAPDAATVAATESASGFAGTGDSAETNAPVGGSGSLTLVDDEGIALAFGLPAVVDDASGVIADGGSVVYEDPQGLTDVVVQPLEDGVRIQTVIAGETSPTVYTYELPAGLAAELQPDGSVSLLASDGGATLEVAHIAAPWATDATGRDVPTHYVLSGGSLTQVVSHIGAGTTYPVVADPTINIGWKIYVRYNKTEVKRTVTGWIGNVTDKAKYTAIICGAIGNWVAAGACFFYVYDSIASVMNTFKTAATYNQCMELQYLYPNGMLVGWKRYSC
jgi:hypothetical protein